MRGHWGAIAKSNFSGLRFREPVYRSVRELVMSYFEAYINLRGERTLRAYSRPVNLARFDRSHRGWMTSEADLWWIAEHLVGVRHTRLLTSAMTRSLSGSIGVRSTPAWSDIARTDDQEPSVGGMRASGGSKVASSRAT